MIVIDKEIWKDIIGYEGYYQVSNLGNVRSLDRLVPHGNRFIHRTGRMCKFHLTTDGYYQVKLSKFGKDTKYLVHRLVITHFNKPLDYQDGWEVNHIDAVRTNNRLDNLEYVTHKENINYSAKLGHMSHYGKDNPNFGHHSLKEKYANNLVLAKEKQGRPGKQNGMCKKIKMINTITNDINVFDYIGECAKFLIDNKLIKSNDIQGLANRISSHAKIGDIYHKYKFEFV